MVDVLDALGSNTTTLIQRYLTGTYNCDYAVITDVVNENTVTIEPCVVGIKQDYYKTNITLVSPVSSLIELKVIPKKGDKVIVFFPKNQAVEMFDSSATQTQLVKNIKHNNMHGGIGFLCNAWNEGRCDNEIIVSEENNKAKVVIKFGNISTEVTDGELVINANNKVEIKISSNGDLSVDAKANKITIKNTTGGSLKSILDSICDNIKNIVTIGSPATQKLNPASSALFDTNKISIDNLLGD